MKKIIFILICLSVKSWAQEQNLTKEELKKLHKAQTESTHFAYKGFEANKNKKTIESEMDYRKAISKNKNNTIAQYNMGDLLFNQKAYKEASGFYQEASISKGATKEEKHKAYHNLGNIAMQEKEYDKAVLAYKEALRNNPDDDETRYNLAVAKEMLKKNPPQNQDNQNKDKNQDKKDQNNQGNNQNNDNKEGDKQENKPQQPGESSQNKISPEQAKRILEAMSNEEKKTQEKINAQRVKGRPIRSEKDW